MKAIVTTYKGPTNSRGSRIEAMDSDRNRVLFDHSNADSHDQAHANAARALCKKMGWTGHMAQGSLGPGKEVFVWIDADLVYGNWLDSKMQLGRHPYNIIKVE